MTPETIAELRGLPAKWRKPGTPGAPSQEACDWANAQDAQRESCADELEEVLPALLDEIERLRVQFNGMQAQRNEYADKLVEVRKELEPYIGQSKRLGAEIETLKAERDAAIARADATEKAIQLACGTRSAAVDALQLVCKERDHLLNKFREMEGNAIRERCRADDAVEQLAGLIARAEKAEALLVDIRASYGDSRDPQYGPSQLPTGVAVNAIWKRIDDFLNPQTKGADHAG